MCEQGNRRYQLPFSGRFCGQGVYKSMAFVDISMDKSVDKLTQAVDKSMFSVGTQGYVCGL